MRADIIFTPEPEDESIKRSLQTLTSTARRFITIPEWQSAAAQSTMEAEGNPVARGIKALNALQGGPFRLSDIEALMPLARLLQSRIGDRITELRAELETLRSEGQAPDERSYAWLIDDFSRQMSGLSEAVTEIEAAFDAQRDEALRRLSSRL